MRRGFTLMEIMVVVVIIAVLSEVAAPMVSSITDESRRSATKGKMKALKDGIMAFRMDIGRLPHWGNVYNAVSIDKAGTFFITIAQSGCTAMEQTGNLQAPPAFCQTTILMISLCL